MDIVDLTAEHEPLYFVCLEDWSEEMKEAGDHKQRWYQRMKDRGLRVRLALDDTGQVGGMIQCIPMEHSPAEGEGLYFINCIWVHGYQSGRGNFQKKGMGQALLKAAEDAAWAQGASGIAAWGLALPMWMKASWFRKHGYRKADRQGIQSLVWKSFSDVARPPRWIRQRKSPEKTPGQVTVTGFLNGSCPAQSMVFERAKRAAAELGGNVVFRHLDTSDRDTFLEWGIADALYIDGKSVRTGPPPSYEKIRKAIASRLKKL